MRKTKNTPKRLQINSIAEFSYVLDMLHGKEIVGNPNLLPAHLRDNIMKECQQLLEILKNKEYNHLAKEFFEQVLGIEMNTPEALVFFKTLFLSMLQGGTSRKRPYDEVYIARGLQFSANLGEFLEQYISEVEQHYRDYCMQGITILSKVNELKNLGEDISLLEKEVYILAEMLDFLRIGDFFCLFATQMNIPQSEKGERKQMVSYQVKFRMRLSRMEHAFNVLQEKIDNFEKYKQQAMVREKAREEKRIQKEQLKREQLMLKQSKMSDSHISHSIVSQELNASHRILRKLEKSECRLKNLETKGVGILTVSHWEELKSMNQKIQEIPESEVSEEIRRKQQDVLDRIEILFQQREDFKNL